MGNFRVFRGIRQGLESSDRFPVFITGQVNVIREDIMGCQILPDKIQLFRRSNLPWVAGSSVTTFKNRSCITILPAKIMSCLSPLHHVRFFFFLYP